MWTRTNRVAPVFVLALLAAGCGEGRRAERRAPAAEEKASESKEVGAEEAKAPAEVTRPLLLFGLDGATWKIIDPLMAEGVMPNFSRLVAAGSRGPLRTYKPTLSPLIWTTMATGFGPRVHGIESFVAPIPGTVRQAIVSSNMRRVKALWNIFSERKTTVGVVGWWATYPAEPVNGFVISDQSNDLRRDNYLRAAHVEGAEENVASRDPRGVFPPMLGKTLAAQLQLSPEVTREELGRFFDLPKRREDLLTQPFGDEEDILSIFKFSYLIDKSFIGAGLRAFEQFHPTFAAIYLNGLDGAEHHFWKFMEPGPFPFVPKADVARYKDVIRNYYIYMDEALGRLLELYPLESSIVVVVSDHGHEANKAHDPRSSEHFNRVCSGTHDDAPDGVIVIAGVDAVKGADIAGTTVIDVAPTVLELLGAPVAQEMPGHVVEKAIDPAFLAAHPIRKQAGLSVRAEHSDIPIPSQMTDALKDKLKGLGYIE